MFDVTKGKSHYGVGGGYNHFAGRSVKPISKLVSFALLICFVIE